MKLILFSYPEFFDGETAIVVSLLEKFDIIFHLRKPKATENDYKVFLDRVPKKLHAKIVLHGAYQLQEEYALKGLHFSAANRSQLKNIKVRGIKTTSCHSLEELQECDGDFNYCFISPVFQSISKPDYKGDLNLVEIQKYISKKRHSDVIALGGITVDNVSALNDFDGVAVLGHVWTENTNDLRNTETKIQRLFACIQ